MSKVLIIADTQHPFDHKDYLRFLKAVSKKYSCDTFVHVGDEIDSHALADWDHDPDGMSAGDELKAAIKRLKPYYEAFPEVRVCESNHTARAFRKAFKAGINKAWLKDYREALQAPKGWQWADKYEIDGVVYKHGLGYSGQAGALKAAMDEMKPCVIGHLHSDAGILYWANTERLLFGMNVGSGIDRKSYAFEYGKHMRKKPILSCGVVINGIPFLLPMIVNKRGRWIGKL
jgi:hypothetical protein